MWNVAGGRGSKDAGSGSSLITLIIAILGILSMGIAEPERCAIYLPTDGHLRRNRPFAPSRSEMCAGDYRRSERLHSELRERQDAGPRRWFDSRHRGRRLR